MYKVDLNCDMGEGFGNYKSGDDEQLIGMVSSINIACGFHAGDPATMRKTVKLALDKGVRIGAHPGLPDLTGFGRRGMDIAPQEAYDLVVYQLGALYGFVQSEGGVLQHVKPHGALYNMAARDRGLAEAIAKAVYKVNPRLILFGLAGSELIVAGQKIGLRIANEGFSDRTYEQDGSLTSRRLPDSLITDDDLAAQQVIRMVKEGKVISRQGIEVNIAAETICIHGDGPHAFSFACNIKQTLQQSGVTVQALT